TAPSASTSADTVVVTAMSKSVPDSRRPCFVTSTRTLASTGRVVLAGIAAATPLSPSCSCSRVIVNFIRLVALFQNFCGVRLYYSTRIELLVVVVGDGEMWVVGLNWCPAQQLASRRRPTRLLGLLVSRAFPTSPCGSHTRPHGSFPDVGYSADNSWRAIST